MTTDNDSRTNRPAPVNSSAPIVRALRDGVLRLGDVEVPCYVLPDGTDLLTKREIIGIFAGRKRGDFGAYLAPILGNSSEIPLDASIRFRLPNNNAVAEGYRAEVLVDICNLYVRALAAGTLHPKQVPLAARAAVIVTACAKVGITALVWEATGYDKVKAANALQDRLALVLREEAAEWAVLFTPAFFAELARLFRLELRGDGRRPMVFAAFIAEFFYGWLGRDVYAAIKAKNPRREALDFEREHKHHQFLTEPARAQFDRHQRDVLILMRASSGLDDFRMRFNAAFRGGGLQLSLGGAVS